MSKKFPTVKRYGGEGAETMMGFFDETFLQAAKCKTIRTIAPVYEIDFDPNH